MSEDALDIQLRVWIDQLAILHVDQKCKMSQEVSAEDGLLNISNAKNPRK